MKKLIGCIAAAALVCALALPAAAQDKAEWSFYGQAITWTAFEKADSDTANRPGAALPGGTRAKGFNFGTGNESDTELDWKLTGTSRFGAKAMFGDVGGEVQFRHTLAPRFGDYAATIALLYGTWNFGPGTLVVGKDFSPFFFPFGFCGPGGSDCAAFGYGAPYGGRLSQIKLRMGGFQIALLEPRNTDERAAGATGFRINQTTGVIEAFTTPALNPNAKIPKIDASYSFNLGPAAIWLGGSYNTYEYEFVRAGVLSDISVDSYALSVGVTVPFGPLTFKAAGVFGQNMGDGGRATILGTRFFLYDDVTNQEEDAEYLSFVASANFKVTDTMSFEAGFMWQKGEVDEPGAVPAITFEETTTVFYLNARFNPARNFFIIPELAVVDYGKFKQTGAADVDFGKLTYLGVKWQINF